MSFAILLNNLINLKALQYVWTVFRFEIDFLTLQNEGSDPHKFRHSINYPQRFYTKSGVITLIQENSYNYISY